VPAGEALFKPRQTHLRRTSSLSALPVSDRALVRGHLRFKSEIVEACGRSSGAIEKLGRQDATCVTALACM
jgi:hypothetical protein